MDAWMQDRMDELPHISEIVGLTLDQLAMLSTAF
jgi:hypothetical protein